MGYRTNAEKRRLARVLLFLVTTVVYFGSVMLWQLFGFYSSELNDTWFWQWDFYAPGYIVFYVIMMIIGLFMAFWDYDGDVGPIITWTVIRIFTAAIVAGVIANMANTDYIQLENQAIEAAELAEWRADVAEREADLREWANTNFDVRRFIGGDEDTVSTTIQIIMGDSDNCFIDMEVVTVDGEMVLRRTIDGITVIASDRNQVPLPSLCGG